MNKFPRCLPIIQQLRDAPSVELELQRLQAGATDYQEGAKQLAAVRYYLQDILSTCPSQWLRETQGISNYLSLVDKVKQWKKSGERVCFVTFNYDTLLDGALKQAGYPFTDLPAYIASDIMLIKLHGSVNWGRTVISRLDPDTVRLKRIEIAQIFIEYVSSLQFSRDYTLIGEYPPAPRDGKGVFPALAIPIESKLNFECPTEHVKALEDFLPYVTKILTIGWGAREQTFLDLLSRGLKSANPHIMVVCGTPEHTKNSAAQLSKRIPATYYNFNGGFTDFMRSGPNLNF